MEMNAKTQVVKVENLRTILCSCQYSNVTLHLVLFTFLSSTANSCVIYAALTTSVASYKLHLPMHHTYNTHSYQKCGTKQLQLSLPLHGGAAMLWGSRRRSGTSTTRTIGAGSCFRVKLEWCVLWCACTAWWRIQHMVYTQTVVQANVIAIVVPSISTSRLAFMEYKTTLWLAIIWCRLGILHHHLLPAAEQAVTYTGN